jgi:hypothetical protein
MARENESAYGAWCAVKETLPSPEQSRAAEEARSPDDFARALSTLSLQGPLSDPLAVENALLCRYARALRIIERFFSSASSEIILWLRSEFDFRNVLLLLKNISGERDDSRVSGLIFPNPPALLNAPDPSSVSSADDILSAYEGSSISPILAGIRNLFAEKRPFSVIEAAIAVKRYAQLHMVSNKLDAYDRSRITGFILSELPSMENTLAGRDIPPDVEQTIKNISGHARKGFFRDKCGMIPEEEYMTSSAARFIDLVAARKRIISVCESSVKAATR